MSQYFGVNYNISGMDGGVFRALTIVASPTGLPTSEVTFADLAKDAGYKTALIGSTLYYL